MVFTEEEDLPLSKDPPGMRTEKRDLGFAFGTLVLSSWRHFGFDSLELNFPGSHGELLDLGLPGAWQIAVHVSRKAEWICSRNLQAFASGNCAVCSCHSASASRSFCNLGAHVWLHQLFPP